MDEGDARGARRSRRGNRRRRRTFSGTDEEKVPLGAIARVYLRIGLTGFGGLPALIAMLRRLCVEERGSVTACPGRTRGGESAAWTGRHAARHLLCLATCVGLAAVIAGGICFALPGLVIILGLSALFLAERPPCGCRARPPEQVLRWRPSPSTPPSA